LLWLDKEKLFDILGSDHTYTVSVLWFDKKNAH